MSYTTVKEGKALVLELDAGIVAGKQMIARKRIKVKNLLATPEQMYETAIVIAGLQTRDLMRVKQEDIENISEN